MTGQHDAASIESGVDRPTFQDLHPLGALQDASNATVLALAPQEDGSALVTVYKPVAGTRPLWDFPADTLSAREVLTYELSAHSKADLVPLTCWVDGPLGEGSVQLWIGNDGQPVSVDEAALDQAKAGDLAAIFGDELGTTGADVADVVTDIPAGWHDVFLMQSEDGQDHHIVHAEADRLRQLAIFDIVTNNADRKIGHIVGCPGAFYGIDNGLTFHESPKLRTIVWGFAGQSLTSAERTLVQTLGESLAECRHAGALTDQERAAFTQRVDDLLENGTFPRPALGQPNVPWPPW